MGDPNTAFEDLDIVRMFVYGTWYGNNSEQYMSLQETTGMTTTQLDELYDTTLCSTASEQKFGCDLLNVTQ